MDPMQTPPPPPGMMPGAMYAPATVTREYLQAVALYQKGVLFSILAYLVGVVLQFMLPATLATMLLVVMIGVSITATVFVFLLATKLYGTGGGVVMGLLTLIPLVGLIILLIVNSKATATLRANGISVGMMGGTVP